MRKTLFASLALTGAVASAVITPAVSNAADTIVTFGVAGGLLEITANSTAELTQSGAQATGDIANVKVTDNRRGIAGWTAYASSTAFKKSATDETPIPASAVSYLANSASATGLPVGLPPLVSINIGGASPAPVLSVLVTLGANTVSWNGGVTVALPTQVVAGAYSGTVVHSVA